MNTNDVKILLVDDEPDILEIVGYNLKSEGYQVFTANNGAEAVKMAKKVSPHLILLDIMMPQMDGIEACEKIRNIKSLEDVIISFLTARGEDYSQMAGFDAGADDYITKPFNPRELTIRARNLLSRIKSANSEEKPANVVERYKFSGWVLDVNSRSLVSPTQEQFKLPRSEFRAMIEFLENPGKILTRSDLLMKMTGRELKPHDRTVDVTIRRIRKHFESHPGSSEIIATIHGEGYRFCSEHETE